MDQSYEAVVWRTIFKNAGLLEMSAESIYQQLSHRYVTTKALERKCSWSDCYATNKQGMGHILSDIAPLDLSRKSLSVPASPESCSTFDAGDQTSSIFSDNYCSFSEDINDAPLDLRITSNAPASNKTSTEYETAVEDSHMEDVERCFSLVDGFHPTERRPIDNAHSNLGQEITYLPPSAELMDRERNTQNLSDSGLSPPNNEFSCSLCHCTFNDEPSYNKHMNLHSTKLYNCYMCGRAYKQARDYRAHVAAHKNGSIYKCDICTCVLANASDYLQHLKTHRQKDLLCCHHCNRYFRDGCTLATHMRTHTGEKPYKCDVCGKKFRQSGTYHRHRKVHDEAIMKQKKVRLM